MDLLERNIRKNKMNFHLDCIYKFLIEERYVF